MIVEPVQKSPIDCPKSRDPRGVHNFPVPGADCLYCGVSQDELSGRKPRKLSTLIDAFDGSDVLK